MTITTELAQELRERYTPKPAPKCHICGAELSIRSEGDFSRAYACFHADHYEQSCITIVNSGDADVIALLDALTKTERLLAQSMKGDRVVSRRKLTQLRSDVLTLEDALARSDSELIAARQRIAEMEARTGRQPVAHDSIIAEQLANVLSGLTTNGHQRAVISCAIDRLNHNARIAQTPPAPAPVTVKLPERYDIEEMSRNPWESYRCIEPDEDGEYLKRDDVLAMLTAAGIKIAEGE